MKIQNAQCFLFRLKPGEDLKISIEKFVTDHKIKAGWIFTCAGSLTHYSIRSANQTATDSGAGYFDIVSLTGMLTTNGT